MHNILILRKNGLFSELISYDVKDNKRQDWDIKERERDYKSESSMRSRKAVIDYALNNEWNYFLTITIDKKLHKRTDYKSIIKKLRVFLNHYKSNHDNDFKYVLIQELHKKIEKDGKKAIHFHGLVKIDNIDYWQLKFIEQKDMAFIYESSLLKQKYGINELTKIYNNAEFLGYYISKYITKALYDNDILDNEGINQRYYVSKGLNKSETIEIPPLQAKKFYDWTIKHGVVPDFQHKFCDKWRIDNENLEYYKKLLKIT